MTTLLVFVVLLFWFLLLLVSLTGGRCWSTLASCSPCVRNAAKHSNFFSHFPGFKLWKALAIHDSQYFCLLAVKITHFGEGCMAILITIRAMPFVGFVAFELTVVKAVPHIPTYWATWGRSAVLCRMPKPPATTTLPWVGQIFFDFHLLKANAYDCGQ